MQSLPHDWTGQRAATTRLRLETALVQLGDQEIRVEDPATLWLRGQAVHVDSLQLVSRGGSLRLDGSLDREARLLEARAEAVGFDFAFLRQMVRLRHEISGTASGWVEAHGSLDRTRLDGRLTAWAGTWNGLAFDSLFVALHSDAQAVEVEELRLASPSGALAGHLRCGYLPGLGRWLEAQRGVRSEEEVAAAQLSGTLRFDDLDLAAVWQARAPDQPPPAWSARVSSTVRVSGRVAAPELDLAGEVHEVRRGGEGFEVVRFTARYADERLSVQDAEVVDAGQKLLVGGQLPLRLDLRHRPLLLRDAPLVAHVTLPRSSFAIVRRFVNLFEPPPPGLPEGEIEARLDLSGTLSSPQAHGGVQVHAAAFSLRDLEEVYFGVDAQGEFEGKTLHFTALSGRTGDRGTLRGVPCGTDAGGPPGKIVFENLRSPNFEWCLELDHVPIFSIPEMSGLVNGTLTLTNADPHGPRPVPDLDADLTVLEAEITQEFAADPDQGEVLDTDRPEWVGALSLHAPNGNVWIKNTQADAELEGNVQIVRSMQAGLDVKGQARVKRGNYSLYFERFEITRGDLDFSRHPGFDPELDIEARRGRPGRRIYVTLTGPSTQPRLSFRSDQADLTSDEIQQMLLGFDVSEEPVAAVATVAERTLNDLPWLQYFAVDPANTDSTLSRNLISYNVSAGRALSERIFLIYTQGVKSDINQRVSLEVDINRWLLLESSYERRNISVAGPDQPQNAFDVNLKYRHEY
jgi:autotransporter translocation and assembly factor TamB